MIFPIVIYGSPILRKIAKKVDKDYENLQQFIDDLFETMYKSDGIGLAAPQVGKSIRIFIIDGEPLADEDPALADFKKVFINPKITSEEGEEWAFNEGCLSIPELREDIMRKPRIKIEYYDENFDFYNEEYDGVIARVIQHEYDHLQGIMFADKVSPLKKRLLKSKLNAISKGKFDVRYRVKLAK